MLPHKEWGQKTAHTQKYIHIYIHIYIHRQTKVYKENLYKEIQYENGMTLLRNHSST